jgi:hypothetical protein
MKKITEIKEVEDNSLIGCTIQRSNFEKIMEVKEDG